MHQPCDEQFLSQEEMHMREANRIKGEFVPDDEIIALQLWADDQRKIMAVRMRQLSIARGTLKAIAEKFGNAHSGKVAEKALLEISAVTPETVNNNVIKLRSVS